ncbi:MAG: FkbM family methyltransferase [Magnetococcus sp. YQC-3]
MSNHFQQYNMHPLSESEHKLMVLFIFMVNKTRRGFTPEVIRTIMLKRGIDEGLVNDLERFIENIASNLTNVSASTILDGLTAQGINGVFAQCAIHEIQINNGHAFLQHMFLNIVQDMNCSVAAAGPEFFRINPSIPDAHASAARITWITDHSDHLFNVWSQLSDQQSKDIFMELLRYTVSGPMHVRLSKNSPPYWQLWEKMATEVVTDVSEQQKKPELSTGDLVFAKFPFREKFIHLLGPGGCIFQTFYMDQYYLQHANICIKPKQGDHVVDAGSFVGETAIRFAIDVGPDGRIYSFEPVYEHIQCIKQNASANALNNIIILPYGLSDVSHEAPPVVVGTVLMPEGCNMAFSIEQANNVGITSIPMTVLDLLVQNGTIERVDFIKMDIEGAEMEALQGAKETLRKFRPDLAVCIYHHPDHIYQIPEWIANLDLGYHLYMDYYHHSGSDVVLYATVTPPF